MAQGMVSGLFTSSSDCSSMSVDQHLCTTFLTTKISGQLFLVLSIVSVKLLVALPFCLLLLGSWSSFLIANKMFIAFDSVLRYGILHVLLLMNSAPLGRAVEFIILESYLLPW